MRSGSAGRQTELIVLVSLAALIVGAVGVVAEAPSQAADTDTAFVVEITDYDATVTEGDTVVFEATVTNEGATADSQQIHLKNERNEIIDSVADPPVTLAPKESADVRLTWDTGPGDAGTRRVRVVSNHGEDGRTVDIDEGSLFTVDGVEADSPVKAGDDLTATITVTNGNTDTATQDVWVAVDGDRVGETAVELAPGETRNETFTWTSTTGNAGNWTLTAATTGDRLTTMVTVTEAGDDASDDSERTVPTYVEKRDNGAVDADGVVELPGNEVAAVEFEQETLSGLLVVDRLRELPEGVAAPDEPVGMYRIDPNDEFTGENATVTFAYSNEAVDEAALDRVEVLRWNGTAWTALDAEATSDGGQVTVEVETHSFSLFAVTTAGETNTTADETNTTGGEEPPENGSVEGETETNAMPTESESGAADEATASASVTSESEGAGFGAVVALLALAVAAGVAAHSRRGE